MNVQGVRNAVAALSALFVVAGSAGCASEAPPRQATAEAPHGCDDPSPRPGTFCALLRAKHPGLFPTEPGKAEAPGK